MMYILIPTWVFPGTLTPVDSALSLVSPLTSWTEYYHARGLSAESRAAILLTFPLTLYHFIEIENQARLQDEAGCYSSDCITVHYLGPERELDMLPLFKETANLLGGDKKLHVAMVGPEVGEMYLIPDAFRSDPLHLLNELSGMMCARP